MPRAPAVFRMYSKAQAERGWHSRTQAAGRHLYNTTRWRKRRALQLHEQPLCAACEAEGRVTAATVADHVVPHKGDEVAFWEGALQSMCAECHNRKTANENNAMVKARDNN